MHSKRDQIITAALGRFRTSGVCGTTLQDVAEASAVPLGNLYYYFKTRDDLVLAVLDQCEHELQLLLAQLAPLAPAAWLAAYFEWLLSDPSDAARLGCPFGALASELRALGHPAAPRAARIVQTYFDAVCARIRTLDSTEGVAEDIFLSVQGAYAVSRVTGDPALFQHSVSRLKERLLDR